MLLRLDVLTEDGGPVDWWVPPPDKLTFGMHPVFTKNGDVLLLDMYVCEAWHGSRRTEAQCRMYFAYIGKVSRGELSCQHLK